MSAIKRSLNVGVVGMGRMGVPVTRNLAFKARSAMYLQIHSRSMEKARKVCDDMGVDGATCAMRIHNKYSTMTKWCDVVLLCLANAEASRSVLLEHDEALLPNARPGQIIVDHTTVSVDLSRECGEEARKRGAFFLDAPMSGSPKAAFNGQLTLMVGGDSEAFDRLQPIFRMYADTIQRMGDAGSGSAAKLISQVLVAVHNVAAAEAMTMAHKLGVHDMSKLISVLDSSWGSSTMLRRNAPTMQEVLRNPEKILPISSASVDALLSDLDLLHDCGGESEETVSANYPLLAASVRVMEAVSNAGAGDRDMSSVVSFLDAAGDPLKESESSAVPRKECSSTVGEALRTDAMGVRDVEFY
jgi:3-hydroxyisobutyrate dehydrogenase-like beta-hydroxyacid dehydrogenase